MEKHYEITIEVIGDGTEDKKAELIAKVVERIAVEGQASLGNLQAAVTITEKA